MKELFLDFEIGEKVSIFEICEVEGFENYRKV